MAYNLTDGRVDPGSEPIDTRLEAGRGVKIVSLEALESVIGARRRKGSRIVLSHGVFDLFHVGHLRHLKWARSQGDILVVTITADEFVNKGPDRPAFPAEQRAEVLAGLDLVDHVAVVHEPSATPAIRAVKPDAYVKGGEYAEASSDITGKIVVERNLVESFGGEVIYTDDITFSSSSILNKHFAFTDEHVREYLDKLRGTGLEGRIADIFERIEKMRIMMIGETIIDRYVYVDALGKPPKENIMATLHQSEEIFAGGVIAAANNLAAICPNVELVTTLGDPDAEENYESFVTEQLNDTITPSFVYRPGGPTVQKTRFVEPTYVRKLFEVYKMHDNPLPDVVQARFHDLLREKLADVDLVIVCDFGHGLISPQTVELLETSAPFLAVNAQSNAGNIGYNLINKYKGPDFVCLDALEARLAVRNKHAEIRDVGKELGKSVRSPNIIVTHGKTGCYVSNGAEESTHIPSFGGAVVDTVGAGDALYVMAAPCIAAGADCETAGFLGNVAGAITIGIVGHRRSLTRLEVQRYVSTLLK